MPFTSNAHQGHLSLACEGLPIGIGSLAEGRCYALITGSEDGSATLTLPTLAQALQQGRRACWLADALPERSLARTGLESLAGANGKRQLEVLCWSDATDSDSVELLQELDFFRIKANGFFLIEGAERLLNGKEAAADMLERLHEWARVRHHCVLLVFRHHPDQRDPAVQLQQAADQLAGQARWSEGREGISLDVLHWFGASGCSAAGSYRLERSDAGTLRVNTETQDKLLPKLPPAPDEHSVYVMRGAIPSGHPVPGGWHVCDDIARLVETTAAATAATLVMAYDRDTKLRELQETVLAIRRNRGPRVKIVIRENGIRLRHNQESVLLRLGATLIIPAEVPASRWTSLIQMVQGQLYWRDLPRSLDTALADAAAEHMQGYLAPLEFCRTIATMQRHSRSMGISNALVVLPLARGLNPADALRHCTIRRPGDICSADQRHFFLFLYACHEVDVTPTLSRLFDLPLGDLFDEELRFVTPSTIQDAVDAFAFRAPQLPDLSQHRRESTVGAASPTTPADQTRSAGMAEGSRGHVARPVLRPLRLRTA